MTVRVKSESAILLTITIYGMNSLVGKDLPQTPGSRRAHPVTGDSEFVKSALMVSQASLACTAARFRTLCTELPLLCLRSRLPSGLHCTAGTVQACIAVHFWMGGGVLI